VSKIETSWQKVKVAGKEMPVYVALPPTGPQSPVVLVIQEIFGVNAHIRSVTERVAAEGFLALSPDIFYRGGERFECGYTEMDKAMPRAKAYSDDNFKEDLPALLAFAKAHPRALGNHVASMGFCMGGRLSFTAACLAKLQGAVCFYGGGIAQGPLALAGGISCPLLLFFGGQDKHITAADVKAIDDKLQALGKPHETQVYAAADHGFFCDARASYNKAAATDAWTKACAFLHKNLQG
jgi:carboxymethylenebutenolidase